MEERWHSRRKSLSDFSATIRKLVEEDHQGLKSGTKDKTSKYAVLCNIGGPFDIGTKDADKHRVVIWIDHLIANLSRLPSARKSRQETKD